MNIRNQAWSQAYLKASEKYLESIKDLEVGPTKIIFLPIDSEEPGVDPEFGFASPGGDLKINLEYAQSLLSTFLTSNGLDPEEAIGVIISAFDNKYKEHAETDNTHYRGSVNSNPDSVQTSDNIDQIISDDDDSEALKERYVIWTKRHMMPDGTDCPALNFICDGKGNILSQDVYSPIDELPFIDICGMKNFKYWVDENSGLADFTVKFNAVLSEIGMNIRNQTRS